MKNIISTEEDLQEFKRLVLNWMNKLNLYDWDPKFVLDDMGSEANARLSTQPGSRKALFQLNTKRQEIVSIEDCAKHEALELLFADLAAIMAGFFSDQYISDEIHKAINKLMVVLPVLEGQNKNFGELFSDAYARNQGGLRDIISRQNNERGEEQ